MEELKQTARRQFQFQSRAGDTTPITNTGEQRGEILSALSKFAGATSAETQRQMRAKIATSQAIGASRAAQDLLVTEQHRQGITNDDVLATKLAYNAVVGKHDVMDAGNKFVDWYQSNPEADEKTIEAKKQELYQPLTEKYSDDADSAKQFSLQLQDSQFNLMPIQEKIRAGYQSQKHQEALTISMGDMLADPHADISLMLEKEIPAQAKALGINEFDMKKLILSEMKTRAADGDGRLLKQLEKTDWAKELELTRSSRVTYDKKRTVDNATALAKDMADVESAFLGGTMSEAALLKRVSTFNAQYGDNVYTKEYVRSLLMRRKSADAKRSGDATTIANYYSRKHIIPMGVDTSLSEADKRTIYKAKEQQWVDQTNKLIAGGMSEVEANNQVMRDKITWSANEQIVLPDLKAQLSSMITFDPEIAKQNQGLMKRWEHDSELLQTMPTSLLTQYLGKDATYAMNIKENMKSMPVFDAFSQAYRDKYNPITIDRDTSTNLKDTVNSAVHDRFTSGLLAKTFMGGKSATEEQISEIQSDANKRALQLYRSGIKNPDTISKIVMDEYQKSHVQLPNGSVANINAGKLATNLTKGTDTKISETQAVEYADAWMSKYATTHSNWSGEDMDKDDLVMQFNQDGSSFIVKDKYGMAVDQGVTYMTNQIYDVARPEDIKKTSKLLEEAYQNRKKEVKPIKAYERHGFFY